MYTRPRYAKFNTKKTTTTTTQQTENVMKNETKPLPISSSFKKDLPHLKCFIKIFPQKILPWKNESISCTNLLFLKKWIFSCFMSNIKEKNWKLNKKKLSKVAKIISCYKKTTRCVRRFWTKRRKIGHQLTKKKLFCT